MSEERSPRPTFAAGEAPGHKVRWTGKVWEIRWQCRTDIAKRGFEPKTVKMWYGNVELHKIDRKYVIGRCRKLQDEMLLFGHGGLRPPTQFDGTVRHLVECYQTDPDSEYHKLRYRSQINYSNTMLRIVKRHGDWQVGKITARVLKGWHRAWTHGDDFIDFDNPPPASGPHIPMGHAFITHIRVLLSFGAAIIEDDDCLKVRNILRELKFPQGAARTATLNATQVDAIRNQAHAVGEHSLAFAQALQFEGTLRQRDIIGEWLPIDSPGISDVTFRDRKWLRGVRWEEVDQHFVLTHITSKRLKEVEIDLTLAPMVMEELRLMARLAPGAPLTRDLFPASGPMVKRDETDRPWLEDIFRRKWREIATAAGIPKDTRNMDTRAGAITEATSVASLDDARVAATHSQISQTAQYSRDNARRTAKVMELRSKNRNRTPE